MTMQKISTGSYDLNKWLSGGFERGVVSMIAGPPGSGKTNISLMTACSVAKKGNKVIFIDTEGGFSIERVKQIVGEDYLDYLNNILIFNPTNFEEQKELFSKLLDNIKKNHCDLIVVDSMAMLYRLEMGEASGDEEKIKKINKEVASQMRILVEIARKQDIVVLITNQVYGNFLSREDLLNGVEKEMNIVGGDLFKYWSKCIIELKNDCGRRVAILLKHRSLPVKNLEFEIKNAGIFKKSFF